MYMPRRTRHRLPSFGRLLGGVYDEAAGDGVFPFFTDGATAFAMSRRICGDVVSSSYVADDTTSL